MNILLSQKELNKMLFYHVIFLGDALPKMRSDQPESHFYYLRIAAELRVLICTTSHNKPLLFEVAKTYGINKVEDGRTNFIDSISDLKHFLAQQTNIAVGGREYLKKVGEPVDPISLTLTNEKYLLLLANKEGSHVDEISTTDLKYSKLPSGIFLRGQLPHVVFCAGLGDRVYKIANLLMETTPNFAR